MTNRSDYVYKNVKWGYLCTLVTYLLGFILRTLIINKLGQNYAGVNGLFTNILGVLSFAELGIGTALNYSLYKPIAENDNEKINSLMQLYKRAYGTIAFVITICGLLLLPFLKYLVKDPGEIGDIRVYYVIILFNTVTSYFVSYKFNLANAKQENFIYSILNMLAMSSTYFFQIIAICMTENFLVYLLAGAIADLFQKIWISIYLNRRYPILKKKIFKPLPNEEKQKIWKDTKALIWHKIGDVSVHQTDNIIISSFVNVSMVGCVTYYNFFINAIHQMLLVALNAVVGSLGNVLIVEKKEQSYEVFKVYRFVAFWIYGFFALELYFMLSKLIVIFVGEEMKLANIIVLFMIIDFYMIGHRCALNNMKMAGGIFRQDQYLSVVQAIVNLVVSILLVIKIGVLGVYIGTVVQGTISTLVRPFIVYPDLFNKSAREYFYDSAKYTAALFLAGIFCAYIDASFFVKNSVTGLVCEIGILTVVINLVFILLFYRTKEFKYLYNCVMRLRERE